MRILFTNQAFDQPAGTELYVRDVALELKRRGHDPCVYSPRLGALAEELHAHSVQAYDSTATIKQRPDVIHGHHHLETLTALLHFADTPAVGFCHGLEPWQECPLKHPRVLQYVAVSELTAKRVRHETGAPADRVHRIPNFVDVRRFLSRAALPGRPARALVFDNYLHNGNGLGAIREACRQTGLSLDAIGRESGVTTRTPELHLPQYDLVFAAGRSALEALAVGTAVIVCSAPGLGGMVTPQNLANFRRENFGLDLLAPCGVDEIVRELQRYERESAAAVSQTIRETVRLEDSVDELVSIYETAIELHSQQVACPADEIRALAEYFREWAPKYRFQDSGPDAEETLGHAGWAQRLAKLLPNTPTLRIGENRG